MSCPHVDNSANYLDGYHCKIIGGKVNEYSITRCYCSASAHYVYCPYNGGDDRMRSKPKPEPEPEVKPAPRSSSSYYDEDDYTPSGSTGGSSGSYSSGGGGIGAFSITVGLLGIGAIYLVLSLLGVFQSRIEVNLNVPEGVNGRDIILRAVSLASDPLYDSRTRRLDETGSGKMKIRDGENHIYLEYDGVSVSMGPVVGDSNQNFGANDFTYEDLSQRLVRTLLVQIQSTDGTSLSGAALQVTTRGGEEVRCILMTDGQYALILPNDATAPELCFQVPGYTPLTVSVDMSERVAKMSLTFAQAK